MALLQGKKKKDFEKTPSSQSAVESRRFLLALRFASSPLVDYQAVSTLVEAHLFAFWCCFQVVFGTKLSLTHPTIVHSHPLASLSSTREAFIVRKYSGKRFAGSRLKNTLGGYNISTACLP